MSTNKQSQITWNNKSHLWKNTSLPNCSLKPLFTLFYIPSIGPSTINKIPLHPLTLIITSSQLYFTPSCSPLIWFMWPEKIEKRACSTRSTWTPHTYFNGGPNINGSFSPWFYNSPGTSFGRESAFKLQFYPIFWYLFLPLSFLVKTKIQSDRSW